MTGVLELISSALGLTETILKYIQDGRGYELKKDIQNLMEAISEQENLEGHLRDDGMLNDLHDALSRKLLDFSTFLGGQDIQQKND